MSQLTVSYDKIFTRKRTTEMNTKLVKLLEAERKVEVYRREYLESKQMIPPRVFPEVWKQTRELRDIRDKAIEEGKLPRELPDCVYDNLETQIHISLKTWQFLRRSNDAELSKQAQKRIRKAWEALHVRIDGREKINVLELWRESILERMMVSSVLEILHQVASPNGKLGDRDKKFIAARWGLKQEEVEEIWLEPKKWRALIRERLARRYQQSSVDRINRLLPKARKAYVGAVSNEGKRSKSYRRWGSSMADTYRIDDSLKPFSKYLGTVGV